MTVENLSIGQSSNALTQLASAVQHYIEEVLGDLYDKLSDADLIAELQSLEVLRRRLPVADHRLITQLEQREVATRLSAHGTAGMLQAALRLSPYEAKSRHRAARLLAPQRTSTGEEQAPALPSLAASQEAGLVSVEQASVIAKALDLLPTSVSYAARLAVEEELTAAATTLRPRELGILGQRLRIELDPHGVLASDEEHRRHRSLAVIPRHDGSYLIHGRLTPACGAQLLAWLSPRSAPHPLANGVPDLRNAGQRLHDALEQLASLAIHRRELHDSGAPAQVIIMMTADQLADRQGWAETSLGQLISVPEALKLADQSIVNLLVQQANGAVLAQGRASRIANRRQTLALIARDKGCSFPDCDRPPEWTQRHHVVSWADGGRTDVSNLTLVCGRHHREFESAGWRCVMADGLPWWIPPQWIDPQQRPRQNFRIMRR
jgi:Domain of unknown function (DUF222)/HNH endonuclease